MAAARRDDRTEHRARADARGENALKADAASQQLLLEIQRLDSRLDHLHHRRRTLPEVAELESLAAEHSRLRDQEVQHQTVVSDLEAEQSRADADVNQVRDRKARDQHRLDSGQVTAAKELESLQSEIASLERRQGALEETELEIMERLEESQQALAAATSSREDVAERARSTQQARDAAWTEIDAEIEQVTTERGEQVRGVPAELLELYEKIRADREGVGAAALRQKRCEGCRLELDPAELARLRSDPDDVVERCEECRRILVRTPESGL
ncbi:MAG TPA: C4-type zinc ribbon domain-containing protein [Jiangellaceae bacterium]|nr:C4-type zinc ribbon domain-containing protein [Jiangellaceae bacterium]